MGIFDFFKKKETGFYEGETFYQLTKQKVIIYKDGKEIGTGFFCISIFENYWDEDLKDHVRQEDDRFFILNGKILTEGVDFDYEDTVWDDEREISHSNDLTEITQQYEVIKRVGHL